MATDNSLPSFSKQADQQTPKTAQSPDALQSLFDNGFLKRGQIWRASQIESTGHFNSSLSNRSLTSSSTGASPKKTPRISTGISSGYQTLDQLLVDRGWPASGLTEVLHDQPGLGELRLLTPALAYLSQNQNRWIVLVSPPYIPYAPALACAGIDLKRILIVTPQQKKDQLWVIEKTLNSSSCSAVMAWTNNVPYKQLRRLQVASKTGECMGVLYRQSRAAKQPSPAELRLQLLAHQDNSAVSDHSVVNLKILKRKGGWATETFPLELNDELNQFTPDFSELPVTQHSSQPDLIYMEHLKDQHALQ